MPGGEALSPALQLACAALPQTWRSDGEAMSQWESLRSLVLEPAELASHAVGGGTSLGAVALALRQDD